MDRETIQIQLIKKGLLLKDLSERTGISYDRLQKILHDYRPARTDEIRAIARAIGVPESDVAGHSEA
jgi:lambda repressor-like predicted transcriptional regulator